MTDTSLTPPAAQWMRDGRPKTRSGRPVPIRGASPERDIPTQPRVRTPGNQATGRDRPRCADDLVPAAQRQAVTPWPARRACDESRSFSGPVAIPTVPSRTFGTRILRVLQMHLTSMDLRQEELTLLGAARRREPGALRALACSLDERLADEGSSLDGVVCAWQAHVGGRARTGRRSISGVRGRVSFRFWPSRRLHEAAGLTQQAPPIPFGVLAGSHPAA